jgi:hypothetical protein
MELPAAAGVAGAESPLIGDLEARAATSFRGGGAERQAQRASGATLLADHVAEIVLMDAQFEHRVAARLEHLDLDSVRMVDEALGHLRDQVAQLEIGGLGIA